MAIRFLPWIALLHLYAVRCEDKLAGASAPVSPSRGSALRLGFRKVLARRLYELESPGVGQFDDDSLRDVKTYGESERLAFEQGYRAAMQDVLVMVGAALAGLAFLSVGFSPALYHKVREVVRPWVVRQVELGRPWVIWVQKFRHPVLDQVHIIAAETCGLPFYITFLPFLFWCGEVHLARQLTLFMATCIYVGNAVKDAISAPRPDWQKGVKLVFAGGLEHDDRVTDDLEYGLPSTHTVNTVSLLFYLFHYYNFYGPGGGKWVYQNIATYPSFQLIAVLIAGWCFFIIHGRLYLGMHSPIDIFAGLGLALVLLHLYIPVEDFVDAWMTSTTAFVPIYQLAFAVLLCWTYPVGLRKTPSYNYAIYFTGVCWGIITGVWRCPHHHNAAAAEAIQGVRGPLLSGQFVLFAGRRFVLGLLVVFALRAVSKEVLKLVVPAVLRALGIPHSDHEKCIKEKADADGNAKPAKPVGYNVLTTIRLLNYAVVGWAVVEPSFDLFAMLGV